MKIRWPHALVAAVATTSLSVVAMPTEAAFSSAARETPHSQTPELTHEQLIEAVKQYKLSHPHDFIGLDRLVRQHTGQEVKTSINGSAPVTAVEAQRIYDEFRAAESDQATTADAIELLGYPTDAFIVSMQVLPDPTGGAVTVLGSWDWRDDFVGQGDPKDIAAIQWQTPDCVEFTDHDAAAVAYDGSLGPQPELRTSGVGDSGVSWNVDAYPVGFVNQADHGVVTVTANMEQCPDETARIGAAFTYEGNHGGSVLGVAVGWGFLSVSYSATESVLQKSTEPVYTNGLDVLEPTPHVAPTELTCIELGHHLALDMQWSSWRCVQVTPDHWRVYAKT